MAKRGKLSNDEKMYIEKNRNKSPIEIGNLLDRNSNTILAYLVTLPDEEPEVVEEPKNFDPNRFILGNTQQQKAKSRHGLGGGPNEFSDDGSLHKEDTDIDRLTKGPIINRDTVTRVTIVTSQCKGCGRVEDVHIGECVAGEHRCVKCTSKKILPGR